ncbi:hypothetical protein N7G274_000763 [Stereocaulon virgatum]|uniref:Azaphilone pigments biosynthesis cluster protein L N-terminal domain-containing protein n=1 Tax=Stereocaulon virgatum TaxID=373712 RepID=A0ABR4AS96_9LECA
MALEGMAALSLAGSIIQLVDFALKIGELTKAFRDNCGELPSDLQRIENLVNDVVPIARRLQDASTTSTNVLLQEQTLVSLLSGCIREAQEFKLILDSFKTTSQTGWTSFLLSLKATRRAGKIRNIEKTLESYKSAMTLRIAEASLARQEYTAELWNQNQTTRSLEFQTTSDALQRLETSVNASFENMEGQMYQISRQMENTRERADQARKEILKLQADHAAWVQDNHNLQRRLRSTHVGPRPMILQFQSMHRRRFRQSPRTKPTRTAAGQAIPISDQADRNQRQLAEREKAFCSINIIICLPVNASPGEMINSIKHILYASWMEVTRRIFATVPRIYRDLTNEEDNVSTIDPEQKTPTANAVLLAFLETHAEDAVLMDNHASLTLATDNSRERVDIDVTCACDFYWKGFSQQLLKINAQVPGYQSTECWQPAAMPLEKANPEHLLEYIPRTGAEHARKLSSAEQNTSFKQTDAAHVHKERRQRKRNSGKGTKRLIGTIRASIYRLFLSLLIVEIYSLLLQDYYALLGTSCNSCGVVARLFAWGARDRT